MLVESSIIAPRGGHLVARRTPDENRKELVREALGLPRVRLDARTLSDLQMIASGVFSPLEGFMLREDYESVVEDKDPLLDGPVPAPSGAELNGRDQLSAKDPTTVV
jgi:ATP sulfurylase